MYSMFHSRVASITVKRTRNPTPTCIGQRRGGGRPPEAPGLWRGQTALSARPVAQAERHAQIRTIRAMSPPRTARRRPRRTMKLGASGPWIRPRRWIRCGTARRRSRGCRLWRTGRRPADGGGDEPEASNRSYAAWAAAPPERRPVAPPRIPVMAKVRHVLIVEGERRWTWAIKGKPSPNGATGR